MKDACAMKHSQDSSSPASITLAYNLIPPTEYMGRARYRKEKMGAERQWGMSSQ
jgi:hypothetical protein